MTSVDEALAFRRSSWGQGYRPLAVWNPDQLVDDRGEPLKNPGKQPRGTWTTDAARNPPDAARFEPDPRATNTGVLCREIKGIDVDVLDAAIVNSIVALIERTLGPTPVVRIGQPPKTLLVYRSDQPFRKVQTPQLFFPDGTTAKVEVLADGQQFVAHGDHPSTGEPYRWLGATPADFPVRRLPTVTEAQARAIVTTAGQILRDAGGSEREKPTAEPGPRSRRNGFAGDFFEQVKAAALTDVGSWVRLLFPRARFEPGSGAWRVSSKDLGRDLEEDISIHPDGIRDFGEEVGRSAIDLVMRYGSGATTPVAAALWLCERLGIDPEKLGYRGKSKIPDPPPAAPEPSPATPAAEDEPIDWEEPPADEEAWPDIDAEAFHGLAGEITFAIAPLTEADTVAILGQLLAGFGSAFGRNAHYLVGPTPHYTNLYEIIAGKTAKARKGTSYDSTEVVLREADPTWAKNCVRSGLSSGEGIIHHAHDGVYVREKVSPPTSACSKSPP